MGVSDRLAYLVTVDPRQAVAGFGTVGQAAGAAASKADAEMARLQKRLDGFARKDAGLQKQIDRQLGLAARAQGKGDMLGADVARVRAKALGDELAVLQARSRDTAFALERAGRAPDTLAGKFRAAGVGAEAVAAGTALATVAAVKYGFEAAKAADRLATAQRATDAIFKTSAGSIREFGENADRALGVSEAKALTSANAFGNLFGKAGASAKDAADLAKGVTSLATVLAAANPEAGNTETALVALQAAFRGEFDPLERFKIKINATIVEQKAMALGLGATTSALTEQDKQLATLQLLYERTNVEQGLFAKNSETLAFRQQQANAALEDFKTRVGEGLVGEVTESAAAIATLVGALQGVPDAIEGIPGIPKGLFGDALDSFAKPVPFAIGKIKDAFNDLTGGGSKAGEVIANVGRLNVVAAGTASRYARSLLEVEAAQKKVTAASSDALGAAQALQDADDRVVQAKKAVAEASDDEAEKAEKVAEARRGEEDAARSLADAERRLADAQREAPENRERAAIASRDAMREVADAAKELEKVRRRRGENDPRTQEARDRLRLAQLDAAEAKRRADEMAGGTPPAVADAIRARDAALAAATEAEKRTQDALAVNPYEAQRDAAKGLARAEQERRDAVQVLTEKLPGVTREIRAGFDATNATREQLDLIVARMQTYLTLQREVASILPAVIPDLGQAPQFLPPTLAQTIRPDFGAAPPLTGGQPLANARPVAVAPRTVVQTQITGPIIVQAQDPDEMGRKIDNKKRLARAVGG